MSSKRAFNIVEEGTTYEIPDYQVGDQVGIIETGSVQTIRFVRGSKLKDELVEKREGTLHEHLISVMIHDLKYKLKLVPSRETALVITHLEEARHWLEERQAAREAEGVSGTYKPHHN